MFVSYNTLKNKILLLFFILFSIHNIFPDATNDIDSTTDKTNNVPGLFIDKEIPEEELKKLPVTFNMGGSLSTSARILFKTFQANPDGGFEPIPNDRWYGDLSGKVWTRMFITEDRYIHLGFEALLKTERYNDLYKRNSINALFNIDEFYFNWAYPIGKVLIGRTNYSMKSPLIFNGPLDGLELQINVPYLNFKSFLGFTGLLGFFNPWFNPYKITSIDRSYKEESNLLYSNTVIKLNAEQARRFFFATDFDIHLFGQHINPYFLLQYDLTSLYYNLNTDYDVNTFHLGINFEGRIITNLYYKLHLSGLFGTHPSSTSGEFKPIVACAVETNLRYTIPAAVSPTFIFGYAMGTGNGEPIGNWSDHPSDSSKGFWSDKYDGPSNNKYYYYGKFDGGYVLNPVLSNIHSLSFKYLITPLKRETIKLSFYNAVYQTIKLWSPGPISDDECDLNDYMVGTELDAGMLINFGLHLNLGMDFGILIPETAYSDKSPRFKMGANFCVTF